MSFLRGRYGLILSRTDTPAAAETGEPPASTPYLSRRLLPAPEALIAVGAHRVEAGERLDQLAARLLGSPLAYWRLADINGAMNPFELCARPGAVLAIPAALSELEGQGVDYDGGAARFEAAP